MHSYPEEFSLEDVQMRLADQKDCYHIFIYASNEFRKKRSHDFYGDMTLKEMELEDAAELILQYIERGQK